MVRVENELIGIIGHRLSPFAGQAIGARTESGAVMQQLSIESNFSSPRFYRLLVAHFVKQRREKTQVTITSDITLRGVWFSECEEDANALSFPPELHLQIISWKMTTFPEHIPYLLPQNEKLFLGVSLSNMGLLLMHTLILIIALINFHWEW